ncbi:polysaccharide pyruvyl transferase family protein, partial [Candidatus Pacearchaeota archaeon]|nr:polysaccharide pyruvyl transferase family protein [Candidatus Pacearchaeota archaeon]
MKIGIITYQNSINNGAILQAKGLHEKLQEEFPDSNIEFINYFSLNLELYELLKCFKLNRHKPFFNLKRYLIFKSFIPKFLALSSEKYIGNYYKTINRINQRYISGDLIICGSDSIWKLSDNIFLPQFPNIYWLSSNLNSKKISYAASAYQYDKEIFLNNKIDIKNILSSYRLIGVRDMDSFEMVESLKLNIEQFKVPDPAFYYKIKETNVHKILHKKGIDINKPIFALITSYNDDEIKKIISFFKMKNYQIIGLSMYNPLVDFNLGDELNPAEWAEIFKYISFCVTDRFHGGVFCIKNNTPFVLIETKGTTKERSKKYQLLKDFNLLNCYADIYSDDDDDVLGKYDEIIIEWD